MNYYRKNQFLTVERYSNFKPSRKIELKKCYMFSHGDFTYLDPMAHEKNDSSITEKIHDSVDANLYNEKVFCESYHVFQDVDVDGVTDNREWAYVRAGIVKDNNATLTLSKTVVDEEDLADLFTELGEMNEVSKLQYDDRNYIDEDTIIVFKPQASAYIAHEILGHSLEEDYYNKFIKNIGGYNTGINRRKDFVFKEFNNYKGFNLRKIDDVGQRVQDEKIIIENGCIKNVITSKEINDSDGEMLPRVRGTLLTGKGSISDDYANCIKVHSISGGYVDFQNNKVNLTLELSERINHEEKLRMPRVTIQIDLDNIFDGLIAIGDDVSVYQNYSVKGDQIIDVFTGAPTMIMKGFQLSK
jgi:hypothetical protein